MVKILIVKMSSYGDIVQTSDVLGYIKSHIPDAKISWVVEDRCKDLVESMQGIDQVIVFPKKKIANNVFSLFPFIKLLRSTCYDVVFDLQGNCKSGLVCAFAKITRKSENINLKKKAPERKFYQKLLKKVFVGVLKFGFRRKTSKIGFGWDGVAEWPNLLCTGTHYDPPSNISISAKYLYPVAAHFQFPPSTPMPLAFHSLQQEVSWIDTFFKNASAKNVLLCPFAAHESKSIDDPFFIHFLQKMTSERTLQFYLLYGTEEEKIKATQFSEKITSCILLEKKLSPIEVYHFMKKMHFVIGSDSFLLHLASKIGLPTVAFFGPTSSAIYAPDGALVFQGKCDMYSLQPRGKCQKKCPFLRSCKTKKCLSFDVDILSHKFNNWIIENKIFS